MQKILLRRALTSSGWRSWGAGLFRESLGRGRKGSGLETRIGWGRLSRDVGWRIFDPDLLQMRRLGASASLLVAPAPDGALFGRGAGEDALGFLAVLAIDGEATDGDLVLFGEFLFLLAGAGPGGGDPAGVLPVPVHGEVLEGGDLGNVFVAEGSGPGEEGLVDFVQEAFEILEELIALDEVFLVGGPVAALDADFAGLDVARADLEADGDTLLDPLPLLDAATEIAFVDVDADGVASVAVVAANGLGDGLAGFEDGFPCLLLGSDGNDDDLLWGDAGRKDESVVIGVGHDERADEASRNTPGSGVDVLFLVLAADEGDVLSLGKVLSEVVGGAGLDGLLVLHHCFDGEGHLGAGEAFGFGFFSHDDGDGEDFAEEVGVELVDHACLHDGLLLRLVRGMAFLPEEFGGAEEEAGTHFPTHDVGPLVDEEGEVTVGLDPA